MGGKSLTKRRSSVIFYATLGFMAPLNQASGHTVVVIVTTCGPAAVLLEEPKYGKSLLKPKNQAHQYSSHIGWIEFEL